MADRQLLVHFQEASVKHLLMEKFDHSPILLKMVGNEKEGSMPLRFISAWIKDKNKF